MGSGPGNRASVSGGLVEAARGVRWLSCGDEGDRTGEPCRSRAGQDGKGSSSGPRLPVLSHWRCDRTTGGHSLLGASGQSLWPSRASIFHPQAGDNKPCSSRLAGSLRVKIKATRPCAKVTSCLPAHHEVLASVSRPAQRPGSWLPLCPRAFRTGPRPAVQTERAGRS